MTATTPFIVDPHSPDADILAAYERVRAARAFSYGFDHLPFDERPNEKIEADDALMVADEEQVRGNFARTVPGIMARLMLAIPGLDTSRWVDRCLMQHGVAALYRHRDELDGDAHQVLWAAVELLHYEWEAAVADYRRSAVSFDLALHVKSKVDEEEIRITSAGESLPEWLAELTTRADALENDLSNERQIQRVLKTLPPSHEALQVKLRILADEGVDNVTNWIARDVAFLAGLTVNLETNDAA